MFNQYKGLRKEVYILFLGRVVTNMGAMIWPMMTLILKTKLDMSAALIAKIMLIYGLACLPISLLGGKLADHFNKKYIIVICDLFSISGYLICAIIPFTIKSIILLGISAIFQSIEGPAYDALAADLALPKDRERVYSLSYLGTNLGLVLSPTIGGILIVNHLELAFFINSISIAISTILIAFYVKDISMAKDASDYNVYEEEIDKKVNIFKYLASNKIMILFIIYQCFSVGMYCQWSYLMPYDMAVVYGDNGSIIYGTMNSLNCITVVLFTAIITKLLTKVKEVSKMQLSDTLELLGLIIFLVFMKTIPMLYVSIFVFTIGEITGTIVKSAYISKRIPASHRGRVSAINNIVNSLMLSLFQLFSGTIYDNYGSNQAWYFTYLIGVIGLITLKVLKKKDKQQYSELYK